MNRESPMFRPSRLGFVLATLFTIANVAAIAHAMLRGEVPHVALHAALTVLGALLMRRLAPGNAADDSHAVPGRSRADS